MLKKNEKYWSAKRGASILLKILLKLVGEERPVILIDETLESSREKRFGRKVIIEMLYAPHDQKSLTQPA